MKKYDVIVIDPPWNISKIKRRVRPNQKEMDYKTMTMEEIKQMPIKSIAKDNSTIFLWIIDKYLYEANSILEGWGFSYHVTLAWNKGNGMCLYGFHRITEYVVVGFSGKHEAYPRRKTIPTSFIGKSERHSSKPDSFYNYLDVLTGEKIDMFARKKRIGWDVWGNEVESDIDLTV